ncbi:MAG: hypothetical protein E6J13_01345, partial [Chloroflexi bacterium]
MRYVAMSQLAADLLTSPGRMPSEAEGVLDWITVAAGCVLLDALEALGDLRQSMVLVGAQAVYVHTGGSSLAVAEYTTDADLAIDPRSIAEEPKLDAVLTSAGFRKTDQPGSWVSTRHSNEPIPVDFLVPERLGGRRGRAANVPGQPANSARQVRGLEGALVDNTRRHVRSLDTDTRTFEVRVAGPGALVVAKIHKISERLETPRSHDKDALDVYRILRTTEP